MPHSWKVCLSSTPKIQNLIKTCLNLKTHHINQFKALLVKGKHHNQPHCIKVTKYSVKILIYYLQVLATLQRERTSRKLRITWITSSWNTQLLPLLSQTLKQVKQVNTRIIAYYKYLSCVPGVDGKIHLEGVVQHRRWRGLPSTPGTHDRYFFLHILFHLILWCLKQ